jgi:hypothetical protein
MFFRSVGNKSSHPVRIESAFCMIAIESSLFVICGTVDIANAAHRTAPMRYAKDEIGYEFAVVELLQCLRFGDFL